MKSPTSASAQSRPPRHPAPRSNSSPPKPPSTARKTTVSASVSYTNVSCLPTCHDDNQDDHEAYHDGFINGQHSFETEVSSEEDVVRFAAMIRRQGDDDGFVRLRDEHERGFDEPNDVLNGDEDDDDDDEQEVDVVFFNGSIVDNDGDVVVVDGGSFVKQKDVSHDSCEEGDGNDNHVGDDQVLNYGIQTSKCPIKSTTANMIANLSKPFIDAKSTATDDDTADTSSTHSTNITNNLTRSGSGNYINLNLETSRSLASTAAASATGKQRKSMTKLQKLSEHFRRSGNSNEGTGGGTVVEAGRRERWQRRRKATEKADAKAAKGGEGLYDCIVTTLRSMDRCGIHFPISEVDMVEEEGETTLGDNHKVQKSNQEGETDAPPMVPGTPEKVSKNNKDSAQASPTSVVGWNPSFSSSEGSVEEVEVPLFSGFNDDFDDTADMLRSYGVPVVSCGGGRGVAVGVEAAKGFVVGSSTGGNDDDEDEVEDGGIELRKNDEDDTIEMLQSYGVPIGRCGENSSL